MSVLCQLFLQDHLLCGTIHNTQDKYLLCTVHMSFCVPLKKRKLCFAPSLVGFPSAELTEIISFFTQWNDNHMRQSCIKSGSKYPLNGKGMSSESRSIRYQCYHCCCVIWWLLWIENWWRPLLGSIANFFKICHSHLVQILWCDFGAETLFAW